MFVHKVVNVTKVHMMKTVFRVGTYFTPMCLAATVRAATRRGDHRGAAGAGGAGGAGAGAETPGDRGDAGKEGREGQGMKDQDNLLSLTLCRAASASAHKCSAST